MDGNPCGPRRQMRIVSTTVVVIVHWHPMWLLVVGHKMIGRSAGQRFVVGSLAGMETGVRVIENAAQQILGGFGDGGRCDCLDELRWRRRIVFNLGKRRISTVGIFPRYRMTQLMLLGKHHGRCR